MPPQDHVVGEVGLRLELFVLHFPSRYRDVPPPPPLAAPPSASHAFLSNFKQPHACHLSLPHTHTHLGHGYFREASCPFPGAPSGNAAEGCSSHVYAGPSLRSVCKVNADLLRKAMGIYQPLLTPATLVLTFFLHKASAWWRVCPCTGS